jgi:hypothetical protein
MITVHKRLRALVSGLAVVALPSPSFAQRSENHMGAAREKALQECSTAAGKYTNSNFQNMQLLTYRTCMMQHGEPE